MKCENYTYLPEQVGESSGECSSVTPQSQQSKLSHTAKKSCEQGSETESCQSSKSLETSENSTASLGEAQLTFFAEDSPAKTSVQRVKEQELPAHVQGFGKNMRDSLEKFGLNLSLPKTHHCFALGDLELSSKTWPKWGMMQDGACWELGTLVRPTNETGCGYLLPTPDASKRGPTKNYDPKAKSQSGRTLQTLAACDPLGKKWPTPTRRDWKGNKGLVWGERSSAQDETGRAPQHVDGPTEPFVGRVAHGVAHRVDRLKAIGNGQVPQCAAMAFRILSQGLI